MYILLALLLVHAQQNQHIRLTIELANQGARGIIYTQFNTTSQPWAKNQSAGEPTNTGIRQQYLLGRTIRDSLMHKASILQEKYTDYQIIAKAAPFPSPIVSAIAQLTGIYTPGVGAALSEIEQAIAFPPVENYSILENVLQDMSLPYYTQVFPVKTNEGGKDYLFLPIMECAYEKEILLNQTKEDVWTSLNTKYASLYAKLEKNLNYTGFNLTSATMLYDDVECDYYEDKKDKLNLDADTVAELSALVVDYWISFVFKDNRSISIANTYMIKEWISIINNAVDADNRHIPYNQTLNFALYVGSSYNLIPILLAIGHKIKSPLNYSSNLMLILEKNINSVSGSAKADLSNYNVYFKLNGNALETFGEIGMKADAFIKKFKELSYYNYTDIEYEAMCNYVTPTPVNPVNPPDDLKNLKVLLICGCGLLLLIIATGIIWNIVKKNKSKNLKESINREMEATATTL